MSLQFYGPVPLLLEGRLETGPGAAAASALGGRGPSLRPFELLEMAHDLVEVLELLEVLLLAPCPGRSSPLCSYHGDI